MGSVPTSLGEWIHSPWLTWDSWCGKGTAPGCAWCLRGAMLLRGFRLFGVALHREPKGTMRSFVLGALKLIPILSPMTCKNSYDEYNDCKMLTK